MAFQDNRPQSLVNDVTDSVGYALAGALIGAAIVWAVNAATPWNTPGWIGIAVGAGVGTAAQWSKENEA